MASGKYTLSVDVGAVSFQQTVTRTGDGAYSWDPSAPAAAEGDLTTRTSDSVGELTMDSAGHGISTSDVVDLYWSGGVRYGITVGTVSGTTVPLASGGAGDVLPAQDTAITAVTQVNVNCNIDGDEAKMVGILMVGSSTSDTTAGSVDFHDTGGSSIVQVDLVANVPRFWDLTGGDNNAFTGNPITDAKISQAGSDVARTIKIVSLEDATP